MFLYSLLATIVIVLHTTEPGGPYTQGPDVNMCICSTYQSNLTGMMFSKR